MRYRILAEIKVKRRQIIKHRRRFGCKGTAMLKHLETGIHTVLFKQRYCLKIEIIHSTLTCYGIGPFLCTRSDSTKERDKQCQENSYSTHI